MARPAGVIASFGRARHDAPANRPWAELPEFYKMSNRRACDHLPIKLAQLGDMMAAARDRSNTVEEPE